MDGSHGATGPGPAPGADVGSGGLPVLFVHSLAGAHRHWRAQLRHLADERRAVAIDLPGHGDAGPCPDDRSVLDAGSDAVVRLADDLDLGRLVLVGHSFGGGVALAAAGRMPGRVAGLLLADPVGDHRDEAGEIGPFLETLRSDAYTEAVEGFWGEILEGARDETRRQVLEDLRATPPDTVIRGMEALLEHDPAAALAPYPGPVLVAWHPGYDQPSSLHRVMPELPDVRFEGDSHWIQMDRPERFNRIVDDFLEGVEDREAP